MPVSEATYERVASEDQDNLWERHRGCLRSKPATTHEHNDIATWLIVLLANQLDMDRYRVPDERRAHASA